MANLDFDINEVLDGVQTSISIQLRADTPADVYCDGKKCATLAMNVPTIVNCSKGHHSFFFVSTELPEITKEVEDDFFEDGHAIVVSMKQETEKIKKQGGDSTPKKGFFAKLFGSKSASSSFNIKKFINLDDGKLKSDLEPLSLGAKIQEITDVASSGNGEAQYVLGRIYYEGKGTDVNYSEAANWFEQSAKSENPYAQCALGVCYELGRGVKQDCNMAMQLQFKAANQGLVYAQTALANNYFHQGNYSEALRWYQQAAKKSNADALYMLGEIYHRGYGTTKNESVALSNYQKAGSHNHIPAMHMCGIMHQYGYGTEKDIDTAMQYYEKAANFGYVPSVYKIGEYYYNRQSYKEAEYWLRQAAEKGNSDAQFLYGTCFLLSYNGSRFDKKAAYEWISKAANQGDKDAQDYIARFRGVYW